MRMRYDELWGGRLDHSIGTTNLPSLVGDGIVMAQAVGANTVDMGLIQLLPIGDPASGALWGTISIIVEEYIQVNERGDRFVAEDARRDDLVRASLQQPNNAMFILMDSRNYPTGEELAAWGLTFDSLVAVGRVQRANTLAELARITGMNPAALEESVRRFNAAVDRREPCPVGRRIFRDRIEVPPFYANKNVPSVHHTMGGIEIDRYTRVLDTRGNVIPGFYAAGEVTGGIHGANRLGANAVVDCVVFGRIAGESAVRRR
jgi:succinate dehydrogenase/fumarate reductase flavoprotein subunit